MIENGQETQCKQYQEATGNEEGEAWRKHENKKRTQEKARLYKWINMNYTN